MDLRRMKRFACAALCVLAAAACASSRAREPHEVMSAALDHADPQHAAVLVVNDDLVTWAQSVVGPDREVVAASRFDRDHPGERVPFNVGVGTAERQSDGSWIVHVHVMAISHPPPGTLFCGSDLTLSVRRAGRAWTVTRLSETVC